ncbi:MAG: alpha-L-fucosidase [Candidatus Hydrogenedentes bacterium]|nr:alpha-L-fucosidase [Candidatus Hydrogenedentota bacterium]
MPRNLSVVVALVLVLPAFHISAETAPPAPIEPRPTARHLVWHEIEFYGFVHFTVNTFTNREWGEGDESPSVFNPSALDVHQWTDAAKAAGMRGLILTAKHHDGFCLWPSKFTDHTIKNSPYKNGQGNVVSELAAACAEAGLKFGVYLSPWDRNHAEYGRPAYIANFRNQLRELLTEHGPIFEVWFDGANGGTGYYGGARENRKIDPTVYYDWANTWSIVRELQPNAVIFSDVGPDIRWVGNERGYAGDPCWATFTPRAREGDGPAVPGFTKYEEAVNGHSDGRLWLPAEVDVSIRPGWFYHAKEDTKVKTPGELVNIYFDSVGRGTSLLLNLPPDQRGLIHENDVASLRAMRAHLDATFAINLIAGANASAQNVRGNDEQFAASNVLDTERTSYWATDDGVKSATVEIALSGETTFNVILLQEYVDLGQRILRFSVEAQVGGEWRRISDGTSIGWKRLLRCERTTATAIRINVEDAKKCFTLSSVGLFLEPDLQTK